jgi:hypothetical protein
MATGFTPAPVPKFTASQIALAHVCAVSLWNGYEYQTGKQMRLSEEEYMKRFSAVTHQLMTNPQARKKISVFDLQELMIDAGLKVLYRSTLGTDFYMAVNAYKASAVKHYHDWKNKTSPVSLPYEYATKAELDWGACFVNNPTGATRNGNYRVPLASRVLFLAMPDMMVFNFSNGLAKEMQFQSRPQAAVGNYNKIMSEGLVRNKQLLNKLDMPDPTVLNTEIWLAAKKAQWWQRRVMDLALLLHYGLVTATPELQIAGRKLAARWRAAQQKRNAAKKSALAKPMTP